MLNLKIVSYLNKLISSNNVFKVFNTVLSLVAIVYVFRFAIDNNITFTFNPKYLINLPILWVAYFLFSYSWSLIINENNYNFDYSKIWFNSLLGKYLPFKIGIPLFRIAESKKIKNDLDSKNNIISLLGEQLIGIFWGIYFGALYFIPNNVSKINTITVGFIFALLTIYSLGLVNKNFKRYQKITLSTMLAQFLVLIYFSLVYFSMFNSFNFDYVLAYIFASSISLFFIGAPAGIGIREYIYIQFLNSVSNNPEILSFAITLRILYFITDLFLFMISKIVTNLYK